MNTQHPGTLVENFDSQEIAQEVIRELIAVGFSARQIGMVAHDRVPDLNAIRSSSGRSLKLDNLPGLPTLPVVAPGIGPAVASGILGVLFWSTATIGAAGAMVSVGVPYEVAEHFEGQFRAGHSLVVVKAGTRSDIARSVLNRFSQRNYLSSFAV